MNNLNIQETFSSDSVLDKHYLNNRSLYLYCFKTFPNIHFVNCINGEKAYKNFKERFALQIQTVHQYRFYDKKNKEYHFDQTIIILNNNCIVEFDSGYCEIVHDGQQDEFVKECTALVNKFKEREKRKPLEINLIVEGNHGLYLKEMEVKRTRLNLDLYYEDDFKEVDPVIQKRLNQKNDKGIVLLHGLPGTGKTTYLRYLICKLKKRVLFLSPRVADNLMNPDFIDLLIDNPNTVLIIEDAENIIMDRRTGNSSAVSNLLNISDGLLADFLNVQLICTFNSPLTMVDTALMRKGRLIAKYEFGKLSIEKARRLNEHLGFDTEIDRPMTVAEITNQSEKDFQPKVQVIGFRRSIMEN